MAVQLRVHGPPTPSGAMTVYEQVFVSQASIYARTMTSSVYAICREARRRAGISQRVLAARAGVSPSTVARIERGRMEPTFDLLTKLVDACDRELRIRITEIDWAGRTDWGDTSFEDRLRSVKSAAELAHAWQRHDRVDDNASPCRSTRSRFFTRPARTRRAIRRRRRYRRDRARLHRPHPDVDTVPAYDVPNLDRLAAALQDLDAILYANPERTDLRADGSPPELDGFELTGTHLRTQRVWQFMTDAGPLDVLLVIDGPGGYDVLIRNAETRTVAGFEVNVASLDDLIESKETAARDKDLRAPGRTPPHPRPKGARMTAHEHCDQCHFDGGGLRRRRTAPPRSVTLGPRWRALLDAAGRRTAEPARARDLVGDRIRRAQPRHHRVARVRRRAGVDRSTNPSSPRSTTTSSTTSPRSTATKIRPRSSTSLDTHARTTRRPRRRRGPGGVDAGLTLGADRSEVRWLLEHALHDSTAPSRRRRTRPRADPRSDARDSRRVRGRDDVRDRQPW